MTSVAVLDMDKEQAKTELDRLAYHYMFEFQGDDGHVLDAVAAAKKINIEHDILVAKAGYIKVNGDIVKRGAKRHDMGLHDGRVSVAVAMFWDNRFELKMAKKKVSAAIQAGNIEAVNELGVIMKLEAQMTGYNAPQQFEVFQGQGKDRVFSDAQKEQTKQLRSKLAEWEAEEDEAGPD